MAMQKLASITVSTTQYKGFRPQTLMSSVREVVPPGTGVSGVADAMIKADGHDPLQAMTILRCVVGLSRRCCGSDAMSGLSSPGWV